MQLAFNDIPRLAFGFHNPNHATPTITLSYDAMGRQVEARDAAGTTTFAHDAFGSLTNETVRNDGALAVVENVIERFTDAFGRDAGYALNGVRQSTLGYDPATGRLRSMAVPADQSNNPNNRPVEHFTWNYLPGSDLKQSLTYPNGLTASWTYGNRGELLEVNNALPTGSVSKYVYTYDAAGRRISCAKSGSAFTTPDTYDYRYNARSELTNATASVDADYRYAYQFDDIGNRELSSERGTNSVYEANNLNQYTAVNDFVPQFDDDGNQTRVKTATGVWQVAYNGENRPVRWVNGDAVITMSYDRIGRRIVKNDQCFIYNGYLQIADNVGNAYVWDVTEPAVLMTYDIPLPGKDDVFSIAYSDINIIIACCEMDYEHFVFDLPGNRHYVIVDCLGEDSDEIGNQVELYIWSSAALKGEKSPEERMKMLEVLAWRRTSGADWFIDKKFSDRRLVIEHRMQGEQCEGLTCYCEFAEGTTFRFRVRGSGAIREEEIDYFLQLCKVIMIKECASTE